MAASKSRDIRNALIAVLVPLQIDSEPAFMEVVGHTGGEWDKYPTVRVLPLDVSNEKGAQSQNDRTVAFVVRTHIPATQNGEDYEKMYPLTDLIIDALDKADYDNTFQTAVGTYLMNVTRGEWQYIETAKGVVLMSDINVEVSYSKNL